LFPSFRSILNPILLLDSLKMWRNFTKNRRRKQRNLRNERMLIMMKTLIIPLRILQKRRKEKISVIKKFLSKKFSKISAKTWFIVEIFVESNIKKEKKYCR
jgi:hypothetical protein